MDGSRNSVTGVDPQCIVSGRPVVPDHSGHKLHGLASGGWEEEENGIKFNGTDSMVTLPDPEISNLTNYSIYIRVKPIYTGLSNFFLFSSK